MFWRCLSMNVSNNLTNAYETKLTAVESKLRSLSGNEKLTEEEKAKETSELKAEKKQLQRQIDTAEDTKRKEELKKLMGAKETLTKMSTVNEARESLTSEISLKTSQYETDASRGGNEEHKKEEIEKLEKRLSNYTDSVIKNISEEEKNPKKQIFSDKEDGDNKIYKGKSYTKRLDIRV